jgi:ABC-type glycerol-3-phosphate transport system permease component
LQTEQPIELTPSDARARLPGLQAELASRRSTIHFARTGVSLVAALILTAASAKLFWDSVRFPVLGLVATLLASALVAYALVQYRRGQRHLRRELELFASLKAAHRALNLDNPSALLPQ